MANFKGKIASPERTILIGADIGTSSTKVAYQIINDKSKSKSQITNIKFGNRKCEVPMMAAWVNGRFVYGFELEDLVEVGDEHGNKVAPEDVIEFFKLCLYKGRDGSERAQRVHEQLQQYEKTIEDLIEDLIAAIIRNTRKTIAESEDQLNIKKEVLEKLPVKVRISVPQMWTPQALRIMMEAAKRASIKTGVSIVQLAYEPQAALAYLISRVATQQDALGCDLRKGSKILVADLGSGTGDFVTYELQDKLSTESQLKAVSESSGALCGSQRVSDLLLQILEDREVAADGGMKAVTARLKLSKHAFRRKALKQIENLKNEFFPGKGSYSGTVKGNARRVYFYFELTEKDMLSAFDDVSNQITAKIDEQLDPKPDVLEVTGGFAKSRYLFQKLRDTYEPRGITVVRPSDTDSLDCLTVCRGILLRYDNITAQTLPSRYSYGVIRQEVYDPKVHTDAWTWAPRGKSMVRKAKDDMVLDPYGYKRGQKRAKLVQDRIHTLISKGQKLIPGETYTQRYKMEFQTNGDPPYIFQDFVYMTKNFDAHAPAKGPKTPDGEYLPDIYPWTTVKVALEKDALDELGYEPVKNEKTGMFYYEIEAVVMMQCIGDRDIKVGFEVASLTDSEPYEVWETLHDSNFSEFVDEKE